MPQRIKEIKQEKQKAGIFPTSLFFFLEDHIPFNFIYIILSVPFLVFFLMQQRKDLFVNSSEVLLVLSFGDPLIFTGNK